MVEKYVQLLEVPEEKQGVFRTSQVVVKDETTGNVIFSPPPFVEVPYLVEDFLGWLNSVESKDVHPLIYLMLLLHF